MNFKEALSKIDEHEYISFDIFDTLICRKIDSPHTIFEYVACAAENCFHFGKNEFYDKRIEFERELGEARNPFSLFDIYQKLGQYFSTDVTELFRLEVDLELAFCHVLPEGKRLFDYAIHCKKQVICISDMYLDEDTVRRMLVKCGYQAENVRIFISAQQGAAKSDFGRLFARVCQKLYIRRDSLLHIGDNWKSDCFCASVQRIHYINIKNVSVEKTLQDQAEEYVSYGFKYFGPLSLGYITWIHDTCKKKKIKYLYFFSREGLILKKIFDSLFDDIETKYIYVSRKALRTPLISQANSLPDLSKFFPISGMESLSEFLKKAGLEKENDLFAQLQQRGYSLREEYIKYANDEELFGLIRPYLQQMSEKQHQNIEKYLNTNVVRNQHIGVVDIGWTGNMQAFFSQLLDEFDFNNCVTGFFVGQNHRIKKWLDQGMDNESYLYTYEDRDSDEAFSSATALLESVYFANHGTTGGYNDKGSPVLEDTRLPQDTIDKLLALQEGILAYVNEIGEYELKYHFLDRIELRKKYVGYFIQPDAYSVDLLGDIYMYDESLMKLAEKVASRFSEFRKLKELSRAGWKVAFIQRNMLTPRPYDTYQFLRSTAKKVIKFKTMRKS